MENFIVSARKYRPARFDEVIGQESITMTLKNAIGNGQLAHAYLFCGPRGVGKTTCARLFAKTINCMDLGPDTEACNRCESCLSFSESRSYNIHELDAASNNHVDDIRNLIDQVRIPPQVGKYSIYIIDEVHMLSAAAFNAFLKTLEEPPAHAVFILATTQKEKIIPTILSRCQIFDFNRISVPDIMRHLKGVADKEGFEAAPEALNIIAQKAEGGMRDALSIFDQIASYSGKQISYEKVIRSLNVLDYEYYFRMTEAFLLGDVSAAMLLFNEILERGFDPQNFLAGLSRHFRDLLMCKDKETLPLLEVAASLAGRYAMQSENTPEDFLFQTLEICNQCDIHYRNSKDPRLHVEIALIRCARVLSPSSIPTGRSSLGEQKNGKAGQKTKKDAEASTDQPEPEPVPVPPVSPSPVPETAPKGNKEKTLGGYSGHGISIRNAIKGQTEPENSPDPECQTEAVGEAAVSAQQPNMFSNERLCKVWNTFADSIRDEYPRIYSTLKNQEIKLGSDFVIQLNMNNRVQEEDFTRAIKPNLLVYLRNELKNNLISVETLMVEEEEDSPHPYTSEEKFEHLAKKNPELNNLKQQFNLDFE